MSYYSMAYMYQTVMEMYDSDKWRWRVRNMSDNQIMAIFYAKLEREENEKNGRNPERTKKFVAELRSASENCGDCGTCTDEKEEFVPQQLSFFV